MKTDDEVLKLIRESFEKGTCPAFSLEPIRKENGEYLNPILEDHWQTYQEGWQSAVLYLAEKGYL